MKKFLFTIILMLLPVIVLAKENYNVTDYLVSSEVEIAGGIKFKELIVVEGDFESFQRDIIIKNPGLKKFTPGEINFEKSSIYNGNSIDDLKVATLELSSKEQVNFKTMNKETDFLEEATNTTLGQNNTFTAEETKDGQSVLVNINAKHKRIAFYYEYVVTNAVVMHKDVAEVYYPFINKKFAKDVKNVQIQLILPFADETDSFHVWAHGPSKGDIKKLQDASQKTIGVLVTSKNLKAKTGLDVRLTFDKDLIAIDNFINKSNQKALPLITKIEEQRTKNTLKTRSQLKSFNYVVIAFDFVYLAGLIALAIYTYLINKKFNGDFKNKYNQEIINDYNVEVIDYLYHHKVFKSSCLSSILNLISKKNIAYEKINKNDYKLTLKNSNHLTDSEEYLVTYLFSVIGTDDVLTISDLDNYIKKNPDIFNSKLSKWQDKVEMEGSNQNFFENHNSNFMVNMIYVLLGTIVAIINLFMSISILVYIWIILGAILYFIYNLTINKRSKKGNTHYQKWQAFKTFLKNFDKFELKALPKVAIWEKYLVYASIFGLYDQTLNKMRTKLQSFNGKKSKSESFILEDGYQELYKALNTSINIKN